MKKILLAEGFSIFHEILEEILQEIFNELKMSKPVIRLTTSGEEAVKMIGYAENDIIIVGDFSDKYHAVDVLRKIDKENYKKVIVIILGPERPYHDFCRENGILILDKMNLSKKTLLPLVKKIIDSQE